MFINDLVDSVRGTGRGLKIKDTNIMYADDVVILAETEGDLQVILNRVCCKINPLLAGRYQVNVLFAQLLQ